MLDAWSPGMNAIRASVPVDDSEMMPGVIEGLCTRLDCPNARDRRRCKSLNQRPSLATSLASARHRPDALDADLCRRRSVRTGPTGVRPSSPENSRSESLCGRGATRVLDASLSGGNAVKTSFLVGDSETMADVAIEGVCRRLYATNARTRRRCKFLSRAYVKGKARRATKQC